LYSSGKFEVRRIRSSVCTPYNKRDMQAQNKSHPRKLFLRRTFDSAEIGFAGSPSISGNYFPKHRKCKLKKHFPAKKIVDKFRDYLRDYLNEETK
jgi:hypothetical protein